MKRQEGIFNLIKSLTKQEKWYFKQFATWNAIKGSSNYIVLFDIINEMDIYDESVIKKKIQKRSLSISFTETKYQLYQNIMKSLHSFHLNSSVDSRIRTMIHQIEILINKAQYDETIKLIYKAKELAIHYERFTSLSEILEKERRYIIASYNFSSMENDLNEIFKELTVTQKKYDVQNVYFQLSDQLYLLHSKSGVIRDEKVLKLYNDVMKNKFLKNEKLAITYEARASYYHCHKIYWFGMQNDKEYYFYCKKHLAALEEFEHMIDGKITRYIGSLYSLGLAQIDFYDFDDLLLLIAKMRAIPEKYNSGKLYINRLTIFDMSYRLELRYYSDTKQFEKGNEMIQDVLAGIEKYKLKLSELTLSLLYYELAVIKFSIKEYNESLHYIDLLLQNSKSNSREDIISILRILQLIIHFELQNELLLPYIIKSTYRYLYKKERLFKVETIIMQYLRKSNKLVSRKEVIKSFTGLKEELNLLKEDPYEKIGLEYVDFIGWLDSKIN